MHLIIYMHPTIDSFNGEILETYENAIQTKDVVVTRRLYEQQFQPVLSQDEYEASQKGNYETDVHVEQDLMERADAITLIFPVWWGGFPAIGKGYLDRVLSYGFAFELDGETPIPKMNDKPLGMIYTTGSPTEEWRESEKQQMEGLIEKSICDFCGFKLMKPLHLGYVVQANPQEHEKMLQQVNAYPQQFKNGGE